MNIVAADPTARVLTEEEVVRLLAEPIPMRVGMVDAEGWPLVHPVWHLFEDDLFRVAVGKGSRKAAVLRATPRAYFDIDVVDAGGGVRGVRGRANVRVIDGDVGLSVDVTRKGLLKYTGTDTGAFAAEMLKWAHDGDMAVIELTPVRFGAFAY